jgi:hypothetical protein
MTAKTINFTNLLYYNPSTNGFNPIVEATMTGPTSIDEGATATFDVAAWGIPDGPVYWWVTNLTNLTTNRISPGLVAEATIDNNRSSFSVTVSANNTTAAGAQSYIVKFGKVYGTALATTTVTVNDTSQTPAVLESYIFNGSSQHIEVTGTTSDWALELNWTIEFWSKANGVSGGNLQTVMSQYDNLGGIGIDIYYENGSLCINNTRGPICAEPTPGEWTHVALVCTGGGDGSGGNGLFVYYNGVNVYTGGGYYLGLSTATLVIGKRGQIPFQYFAGKLTSIRITNTLVYTDTFDPYTVALPPTKVSGTKLLMTPSTLAIFDDLSDSNHGVGPSTQVAVDNDYPQPPLTAFVSGWNLVSDWLLPSISGNVSLTPVVAGWTVTGPLGFTATVIGSPFSNGSNWVITVNASLAGFTQSNAGNYTFTPP